MRNYVVFDNDGNILRTGVCPHGDLLQQPDVNQYVMEGCADDQIHRVIGVKGHPQIVKKKKKDMESG